MTVPILRQGPALIVSMQPDMSDVDLMQLRDDLSELVGKQRSTRVVIDVSVLG